MKLKSLFIAFASLALVACSSTETIENSGQTFEPCTNHVDENRDGYCDHCGYFVGKPDPGPEPCSNHIDFNGDGYCDNCHQPMIPIPVGEKVKIYLCLSSIGLYKGQAGVSIADKFLEYAVEFEGLPGDPLPGAQEITTSTGAGTFVCWNVYEGAGAPTVYTTIPAVNGKILYANFSATGGGGGGGGGDTPVESQTTQFFFKAQTDLGGGEVIDWAADNVNIVAYVWGGLGNKFIPLTTSDRQTFTLDVDLNLYQYVIFTRMNPTGDISWDSVYNKTIDLSFTEELKYCEITCWHIAAVGDEDPETTPSGARWVAA